MVFHPKKNITLSSAEAELVASVKVCGETVGLVQLAADWGLDMKGKIHVDSSAAIGTAHRRGNGKLRHVNVGSLWIQEFVEEEEILKCEVPGAENIADISHKACRSACLISTHQTWATSSRQAGLKAACISEGSQCNFELHAVASWQWSFAQPWLHLRRISVKPFFVMWFSLHSFLVSCTWSTDGLCVSEAALQQKQVVVRFAW